MDSYDTQRGVLWVISSTEFLLEDNASGVLVWPQSK